MKKPRWLNLLYTVFCLIGMVLLVVLAPSIQGALGSLATDYSGRSSPFRPCDGRSLRDCRPSRINANADIRPASGFFSDVRAK